MDNSLPGSSIHGILQARILEWAATSFSRGSSQPRDQTQVSCIADRRFTIWAPREAQKVLVDNLIKLLNSIVNINSTRDSAQHVIGPLLLKKMQQIENY